MMITIHIFLMHLFFNLKCNCFVEMSVILKFKSHLQINKMFVIKHCTKLSQFFASRHIENVSRFSQVTHVSTNLSSFNTDAIVHHISHVADPLVLDLTLGSGSTSR